MTTKERIRFWFDDLQTPMGRATDLVVMALIVAACVIAVAQTYPVSPAWNGRLSQLDRVITGLFLIEYLLRLWVAERRLRYVFKLYSLIDLIAILPAIVILHPEYHVFRIFRLLRIFRLIRFLETRHFFFGTLKEMHLYLIRFAFTLFTIPFVSAGLVFYAEKGVNPELGTYFDAFYFSVVTLTTVGFGDIVPITAHGRTITTLMIVAGIIFIPWQVKNLIAHFLTARSKTFFLCPQCGLEYHERDAKYCKRCGNPLGLEDRNRA